MKERRIAVRAIILKGDKLFCVRLKKYRDRVINEIQDYWCTPGGGVDIGEPLVPALERELIEETGVKPEIGELLYIQQFQHKDWEQLEFFFHVTNALDYERLDLEQTTHGSVEIAEVGFIDPRKNTVLPVFLTKEDLAADAKKGTVRIFNNFRAI